MKSIEKLITGQARFIRLFCLTMCGTKEQLKEEMRQCNRDDLITLSVLADNLKEAALDVAKESSAIPFPNPWEGVDWSQVQRRVIVRKPRGRKK